MNNTRRAKPEIGITFSGSVNPEYAAEQSGFIMIFGTCPAMNTAAVAGNLKNRNIVNTLKCVTATAVRYCRERVTTIFAHKRVCGAVFPLKTNECTLMTR